MFAIPDGDVAASILTCMPDSQLTCCTGLAAHQKAWYPAVIRALDGDMQGASGWRHDVKGNSEENRRIGGTGTGALQSNGR